MIDLDLQKKSIELWREDAWELHGKLRAAENRIEKLEAALRELSEDWACCEVSKAMRDIARKVLEGKDD